MDDENKHNLIFFEGTSMRGLYDVMDNWQRQNKKRLLSVNIQREGDGYSCIALTNPTEVIICSGEVGYSSQAAVVSGRLRTGG
jgi:hypothetical protein